MRPRGGSSRGAPLELAPRPTPAWLALQTPGLSGLERDRRAILAMAGGYRTSFDFIETVGFTTDFEPARPYQSWGTEYVYVVADEPAFISLQHIMVMFVATADGSIVGPIVQKHWRQDWRFEDRDLHVYRGHNRWERRELAADAVAGKWSQAVFQVDDSPRYEAIGKWKHDGNYSAWTSDETWRPLPRRESSVRADYDVLVGINRHTIIPTGWVQEEENLKRVVGRSAEHDTVVAREIGVNRYEALQAFDFSGGDAYWNSTKEFWRDVRNEWQAVFDSHDAFEFSESNDSGSLFEIMFEYAARLENGEAYDSGSGRPWIRETLTEFVR
jgi:hypothetical protein